MTLDAYIKEALEKGASDIHFAVGRPPTYRIHGELVSAGPRPLTSEETEALAKEIITEAHRKRIEEVGGVDFGFSFKDKARIRVSCFKERGNFGLALRPLPNRFFSFEEIGLSEKVIELLGLPRGLILVTGPTGSGKTTTLATMLNYVNENFAKHIITIEDPIEFMHAHKKSLITQREVGQDVSDFSEAVVKALRQDPDVILIGEMRDLATMEAAIRAAETGHLVFATLHTSGAARTVDRIIDVFPTHQQAQVRVQLASILVAVLSQTLLPKADGTGRVAAFELMVTTPAIRNLIREGKTYQIFSEIQTGSRMGMKLLDDHLHELYDQGLISYDAVMQTAYEPKELSEKIVRGAVGTAKKK
ncbi:MAG: type IV pilus twitching motility protein PilT [Candidatus Omnitrophica bacterium]|nr:type IV pilus twitching motility protein PilT [Candidatus Omnitrophota bacterium]